MINLVDLSLVGLMMSIIEANIEIDKVLGLVKKEKLSVDLVRGIIEANFNRYFKCVDIVDYIMAYRSEVSLRDIMDCRKRHDDPYDKYRVGLSGEVTWVLKGLKNVGYIEKYNGKMWRVV